MQLKKGQFVSDIVMLLEIDQNIPHSKVFTGWLREFHPLSPGMSFTQPVHFKVQIVASFPLWNPRKSDDSPCCPVQVKSQLSGICWFSWLSRSWKRRRMSLEANYLSPLIVCITLTPLSLSPPDISIQQFLRSSCGETDTQKSAFFEHAQAENSSEFSRVVLAFRIG